MVARVKRAGSFYEWWTPENKPRGSSDFHGSADELSRAIEMLEAWAEQQPTSRE
jgi:hypothetical protein